MILIAKYIFTCLGSSEAGKSRVPIPYPNTSYVPQHQLQHSLHQPGPRATPPGSGQGRSYLAVCKTRGETIVHYMGAFIWSPLVHTCAQKNWGTLKDDKTSVNQATTKIRICMQFWAWLDSILSLTKKSRERLLRKTHTGPLWRQLNCNVISCSWDNAGHLKLRLVVCPYCHVKPHDERKLDPRKGHSHERVTQF